MPKIVSSNILNWFSNQKLNKLNFLILGITFKENCPDTRNSKIIDIYNILSRKKINIEVCDPFAIKKDVLNKHDIPLIDIDKIKNNFYNAIVVSVGHKQFFNLDIKKYLKTETSLVYDLKGIYDNKKFMRL